MSTEIKSSDLNSASSILSQPANISTVAKVVAEVLVPAVVLLEALAQEAPPTAAKAQSQSLTTGTQTQAGDTGTMDRLASQLGTAVGAWISDLGDNQGSDSTAHYGSVNEVSSADSAPVAPQDAQPQPRALYKVPPKVLQATPLPTHQDLSLAAVSPLAAKMAQRGLQNGTGGTTYTAAVDQETEAERAQSGEADPTAPVADDDSQVLGG